MTASVQLHMQDVQVLREIRELQFQIDSYHQQKVEVVKQAQYIVCIDVFSLCVTHQADLQ